MTSAPRYLSLPLTLLAGLVLSACTSQQTPTLKKGEIPVDVASVVRQKMPASVKDRESWALAMAKTFESQKLAPTKENICAVLAVAQRHRDVAERVLEIVLASLDEPRKPKPGLTRIRRNLYRRGILSRS